MLSMSLSPCCRFHPAEVNSRIGQISAVHVAFALRLQARPSGTFTFEATTRIAVGTAIAGRPPHRSGLARLRHPAPTSGV